MAAAVKSSCREVSASGVAVEFVDKNSGLSATRGVAFPLPRSPGGCTQGNKI